MTPVKKDISLDDFFLDYEKSNYVIITGRTFRKGPIIRGIGCILFGSLLLYCFIYSMMVSPGAINLLILLFAMIFLLGGLLILFAKERVEIDVRNKRIKEFMQFLGRFGSWQNIDKYPFVTVIKEQKYVYYGTYVGTFNVNRWAYSRREENKEFEVCLLNKTHYKRLTLYSTESFADAKEKADKLTGILNVTYSEFNPVRISKSRKRIG